MEIEIDVDVYLLLALPLFYEQNGYIISLTEKNIKTKLSNNIKIYKDNNVI